MKPPDERTHNPDEAAGLRLVADSLRTARSTPFSAARAPSRARTCPCLAPVLLFRLLKVLPCMALCFGH
jgi:hypothetical protein